MPTVKVLKMVMDFGEMEETMLESIRAILQLDSGLCDCETIKTWSRQFISELIFQFTINWMLGFHLLLDTCNQGWVLYCKALPMQVASKDLGKHSRSGNIEQILKTMCVIRYLNRTSLCPRTETQSYA